MSQGIKKHYWTPSTCKALAIKRAMSHAYCSFRIWWGTEYIPQDLISDSWYLACGQLTPAVLWSVLPVPYSEGHWHVRGHPEDALSEKIGVLSREKGSPRELKVVPVSKYPRISQGRWMTSSDLFSSTEQRPVKWTYRRVDQSTTMNFLSKLPRLMEWTTTTDGWQAVWDGCCSGMP